jgi:rubrerythrin
MAIEGETYEYTTMYPGFEEDADRENNEAAMLEAREQARESKIHAEEFKRVLELAQKRFAALRKVEQRHAEAYQQLWESV